MAGAWRGFAAAPPPAHRRMLLLPLAFTLILDTPRTSGFLVPPPSIRQGTIISKALGRWRAEVPRRGRWFSMQAADDKLESLTFDFASHLKEHLDGLWGARGAEDWSLYAANIQFSDPIQSLGGLEEYKKSLMLLKDSPFSSNVLFQTHDVSVSGKGRVRSRWTLSSDVKILPWRPRVVFTGISEYELNEEGKVCKHVDYWDSVKEGEFLGGWKDILIGGSRLWQGRQDPTTYLPEMTILRRGKDYELRRIEESYYAEIVLNRTTTRVGAIKAMNKYWTGYNTNARVISPSQPTFISVSEPSSQATVTVRSFLPGAMGTGKEKSPEPLDRKVMIKRRPGGIFAVKRILTQPDPLDEWISTEQVYDIRAQLLDRLTEEGVKTRQDFKVARFANVYGPGDIRYELWVPVQSFEMRAASLISASNTSKISGLKLDFSLLDEEE